MIKTFKVTLVLIILSSMVVFAQMPKGIKASSFLYQKNQMMLATWIVGKTEWIVDSFIANVNEDEDIPDVLDKIKRMCPSGWHLAKKEEWDKLTALFPKKRSCSCSESGETWLADDADCGKQYCETCMRCEFIRDNDTRFLVSSGFIQTEKQNLVDHRDYFSFSVSERGITAWHDMGGFEETVAFKCTRTIR